MAALYSGKTIFFDPVTTTAVTADTQLHGSVQYTNEITEFPIDTGETISDHIFNKPLQLTMSCLISNTPMSPGQFVVSDNEFVGEESSGDAANTAYQNLVSFRDLKTILTVFNGLDTYGDMAIQTLTLPREEKTDHALYFDIVLKQVQKVSAEYTQIASVDTSISDRLASSQSVGTQSTKATSQMVSTLDNLFLGGK